MGSTVTQSENGNESITPSLADKKSVFDSDVRSEAVESLEWAPEPHPETESTSSSVRLEVTKENTENGIETGRALESPGKVTRTITAIDDDDAVIVFADDARNMVAVTTPMDRGKLQDVATYSSSD